MSRANATAPMPAKIPPKTAAREMPAFAPIAPVRRSFEVVAERVRELIRSGGLRPGDKLPPERVLAEQLNVSRNTLREGLRALELGGVLELRKGGTGGAFIVAGRPDTVVNGFRDLFSLGAISPEQLTEARVWIETIAVRVACERASEAEIAELFANVQAAKDAEDAGDFVERSRIHRQFHVLVGRATHNPIIAFTLQGIMEIMAQFVRAIGHPSPSVMASRKRLLAAFIDRNVDAAAEEMESHLRQLHRDYLATSQGVPLGVPTPKKRAPSKTPRKTRVA